MTNNTIPKYMLLGSVGDKAYATKHNTPPAQSNKAKGLVTSLSSLRDQ